MLKKLVLLLVLNNFFGGAFAQLPPVFDKAYANTVETSALARKYLSPVRIVWQTPGADKHIFNAEWLLKPGTGQADLVGGNLCKLKSDGGVQPAILLDFGREIHGGIRFQLRDACFNP